MTEVVHNKFKSKQVIRSFNETFRHRLYIFKSRKMQNETD